MENLDKFLEEFQEIEGESSGNAYWILTALPVFIFMWFWKADDVFVFRLAYSALAAIATIFLSIIIAVWIPNEQMRKINRQRRFEKSEMLIDKCKMVLRNIKENDVKDREVKENGTNAISTIQDLINLLKLKTSYQGIVEDNLVPGLFDYLIQLYTWYKNQTQKALGETEKDELYNLLTQKDELFQTWKKSGTDPLPYLTSKFRSQNQMQSAGINPSKGVKQ